MEWNEYTYLSLLSHQLENSETSFNTYRRALGKTIKSLTCDYKMLTLLFQNGYGIVITESGFDYDQNYHIVCHQDPKSFTGATFLGMDRVDGPFTIDEYGDSHTVEYLYIHTSRGTLVASHHGACHLRGGSLALLPIEPLWPALYAKTA